MQRNTSITMRKSARGLAHSMTLSRKPERGLNPRIPVNGPAPVPLVIRYYHVLSAIIRSRAENAAATGSALLACLGEARSGNYFYDLAVGREGRTGPAFAGRHRLVPPYTGLCRLSGGWGKHQARKHRSSRETPNSKPLSDGWFAFARLCSPFREKIARVAKIPRLAGKFGLIALVGFRFGFRKYDFAGENGKKFGLVGFYRFSIGRRKANVETLNNQHPTPNFRGERRGRNAALCRGAATGGEEPFRWRRVRGSLGTSISAFDLWI
jgi:hypothetical protein